MGDSEQNRFESSSADEKLNIINVDFLNIIKNYKIESVEETKQKIDDALANEANVNFQDLIFFKRTALYYAVQSGEKEIVFYLLLKGAKVITEGEQANPLKCAEKHKENAISESPEEQNYKEIIDALKNEISRNDPQPSTSHSPISKITAFIPSDEDIKENKQKQLSVSQRDVAKSAKDKNSETYPASGLKLKMHGYVYQLKLLMLFAKRCHDKEYEFRLATEMNEAEKFDDIILEFNYPGDNTKHGIFLQAKHTQKDNEEKTKIKAIDLKNMSEGNFSLLKYFKSYQKIKRNDNFKKQTKKYFIFNANIDLDFDGESKFLKNSTEFCFEDFNNKEIDIFNVKSDDDVKKGKNYKLVGSTDVVSTLQKLFKESTDFQFLAEELANHLIYKKPIELRNLLLKEYRATLVNEVIDIHYNKLREEFTTLDSDLSPEAEEFRKLGLKISSEAKEFRKVLFEYLKKILNEKLKEEELKEEEQSDLDKKLSGLANEKKGNLQLFWKEIGQIELKTTKGFKKEILEKNPKLKDPEKLADDIFHFLKTAYKNEKKYIPITKTISKYKRNVIPEIYKLAGHVLVTDEKNGKNKFSKSFFDDQLAGNLKDFKKKLKDKLENDNVIKFDELRDYTFQITDFVTCKESEVANLLNTKYNFPSHEVNEKDIEDFLNDLIFAVNQPNEEKLDEIINDEVGIKFNLTDSELVTDAFTKCMLDWIKENKGTYITKQSINGFFENLTAKISQLVLIGPTFEFIAKLEKTKIVFELSALPELLLDFLYLSKHTFCHLNTAETSPRLGSIKVIQILKKETKKTGSQALKQIKEHYSRADSYISFDSSTLHSLKEHVPKVFKKKKGAQLLIVECKTKTEIDKNNNKEIAELINELKEHSVNSDQQRLLLIGPTDNALIEMFDKRYDLKIEDKSVFNDLTETSQEHVLKGTCIFQEYEVVLNQLFDKYQKNVTNSIILAKLLDSKKKFKIGHPISSFGGYDKNYFIERIFLQESEKDPNNPLENQKTISSFQKQFSQVLEIPQKIEKNPKLKFLNEINVLPDVFKFLRKSEKIETTLKDLLDQLKQKTHKNFIIISDVAGMGKSTILTHLSQEIKKQSPDHWIVKIELSKYTNALKTLISVTPENVIDFISNKILNIKTPFETELLKHLFEKKKVILLLDAFDEISPNYEMKVLELLEALKSTENQVWVTTRPHYKECLGKNEKVVFCNLQPFSENDQITFLTKFWSVKLKLDDKKKEVKLNDNKIIEYAEGLLKKLTRSIRDNKFTGIPLQTCMLAEAFQDEVKTFHDDSTDSKPAFVEKFDILVLYKKFYNVKHDTVLQKGDVVKKDKHKVISKYGQDDMYSHLALLMLFPEQESIFEINKKKTLLSLPFDRFGIAEISKESKEIQFIHRTFAEYSAAKYFSEALTNYEPEKVCDFFFTNVLLDDKCQTIRYFIDCFLKRNIPEEYLGQYGEQVVKLWIDETYKKNTKTILHIAAREGNLHIFTFLTESLKDKYIDILKSLLEERYDNQLAWHEAANEGHIEILEIIWKWAEYFNENTKTMLLDPGKFKETAWIQASRNQHFDVLIKIWKWAQKIKENQELKIKLLLSKDFVFERNALHSVASNGNAEVLKTLQGWASEIGTDFQNKFLLSKDKSELNAFHIATIQGNIEALKTIRDWAKETECDFKNYLLLSKISNGQTACHIAAVNNHIEVLKMFRNWATETNIDYKNEFLLSKDKDKLTAFHLASICSHVEILKIFRDWATETKCDFKNELLLSKNSNQLTAFHLASYFSNVEVFQMLRDWAIETKCDFKEDFLLSKDENGNTAFQIAANTGHVKLLKMFRVWATETDCDFKKEFLLFKNKDERSAFHEAALHGNIEVLKMLRDWATAYECDFKKDFLLSKDNKRLTAFHLAAREGYVEVLKMLRDWATKTDCDLKNEFFLFKDNNGQAVFHLATTQGHVEVLKMLRDWVTETGWNLKNDLLLFKNTYKLNIIHLAAMHGHIKILKMLRDWATETKCDLKNEFILSKESNGLTAFHFAAMKGHVKVLILFGDWATETDCDFKNDLLLSKSNDGNSAVYHAALYGHVEVVKTLLDWTLKSDAEFKNDLLFSNHISGSTAFHMAIYSGHVEVVKTLLDWTKKTDATFKKILIKDINGHTAFSYAALRGHVDVVNTLLDWTTETDAKFKNYWLLTKDKRGHNVFHLAAENKNVEILKKILDWATKMKCDFMKDLLFSKNIHGQTAFQLAVLHGNFEVVKTLLDWTQKTDATCNSDLLLSKDKYGFNAFHLTALFSGAKVAKILLDCTKKTDATFTNDLLLSKDIHGQNAFHLAVLKSDVEYSKKFQDWATKNKYGFKSNFLLSGDKNESMAFQVACRVEFLKMLRDWATENKCDFISNLLLSRTNNGETAFDFAKNHIEISKMLWEWALIAFKAKQSLLTPEEHTS